MPIHDWTRVEASTFHHFHNAWITHLSEALNGGLLPPGYYAMGEQHIGRKISDVLALHTSDPDERKNLPEPEGAVAVADAPPRVSRTLVLVPASKGRRRTLTIRHTTGHRIIALVEIVSPSNKAAVNEVEDFVRKVVDALVVGIHVVVIDLLPPGRHDPAGMHGSIVEAFAAGDYELPQDKPLTLASYSSSTAPTAYLEHVAVGDELPAMPLFLSSGRYVSMPLATTYEAAYRGMPAFWRDVLDRP